MPQAFLDHDQSSSADPVERLMALLRLRDQTSRAGAILQSYDPAFSASTIVGPVRQSKLVSGIEERLVEVRARGRVAEPLARNLPGMGLERYMLAARELRGLPTIPPALAGELADLLRGYHRAHLIGPGFGGELSEGLMFAPERVNLEAQNEGVEHFIRRAREASGVELSVKARARGARLIVPLTNNRIEYVDVLRHVEYRITGTRDNGEQIHYLVAIKIGDPPDGRPKIIKNTVPADAPGGDVLARLAAE